MGGGEFGITGDDVERGFCQGGGLLEHPGSFRDRVDRSLLDRDFLLAFGDLLQQRGVLAGCRSEGPREGLDGLEAFCFLARDVAAGLFVTGHRAADLGHFRVRLPNDLLTGSHRPGKLGELLDEDLLPLPARQVGPGGVELGREFRHFCRRRRSRGFQRLEAGCHLGDLGHHLVGNCLGLVTLDGRLGELLFAVGHPRGGGHQIGLAGRDRLTLEPEFLPDLGQRLLGPVVGWILGHRRERLGLGLNEWGKVAGRGHRGVGRDRIRRRRLRFHHHRRIKPLLHLGQLRVSPHLRLHQAVVGLLHARQLAGDLRGCGLRRLDDRPPLRHRLLGCGDPRGDRLRITRDPTETGSVGSLPDADLPRPVADDHRIGLIAEGDRQPEIAAGVEGLLLVPILSPDLRLLVAADADNPAVAGELERRDTATVGVPALHLAAVLHLPEADRAVLAAGGEEIGIPPPGDGRDRRGVAGKR